MLEITDIEAGYGRTRVLHGVTVPAGKVGAVLGHNGAGKTTLLRLAIGLVKPSKGRVLFDGEDISSLAPNKRVARGMAYVPQGQQSFGQLTTMENLQLAADGRRRGKTLIDAQLARFPALEKFATRKAGLLSGGQRQQLAIARALITEPKLLILDEPVAGMSHDERTATGELLQRIAAKRIVLVVEHDMDFMRRFATRVTVLHQGKVLSQGTVAEVQADPKVQEVYLGTAGAATTAAMSVVPEAAAVELADVAAGTQQQEED